MSLTLKPAVLVASLLTALACHPRPHSDTSAASDTETYELTLEGPFQDLIYNRKEDIFDPDKLELKADYRSVELTLGQEHYEAQVRLRGGIRFCDAFPQLKLKLPKGQKIADQNEFKMITHGSHDLDPNRTIDIPVCGNEVSSSDHRQEYARENQIYDLATKVLDYSLANLKFRVRYLDAENGLDLSEKAYLIEDTDHAAKRYGMQQKSLENLHRNLAWRAEQEDFTDSLAGNNLFAKLALDYRQLKQDQPELSAQEISRKIMPADLGDLYPEYKTAADAQYPGFIAGFKQQQLDLLQQFHQPTLAQAVLLRIMLGDHDWNLLGLTDHSTGIKNFELLTDGKQIFAIPYDFNESLYFMNDRIIPRETYLKALNELVNDMKTHDNGFLVTSLEEQMPILAAKLQEASRAMDLSEANRASMAEFVAALGLYQANEKASP